MFSTRDIADYYDQTAIHYRHFWRLKEAHALHYGIWTPEIKNFEASLTNTNRLLATLGDLRPKSRILDAGCGIGGSSLFLAKTYQSQVTGITLSAKQVASAKALATRYQFDHLLDFHCEDYTATSFADQTFDAIWAMESMGSALDKAAFVKEAFRVLKPGGKLLIADYFKSSDYAIAHSKPMSNWLNLWAMSELETESSLREKLQTQGFNQTVFKDYTQEIYPSAKRMYQASLVGSITSNLYNLLHPNTSRFAKHHYRSGKWQYRALKQGLWHYKLMVAVK